MINRFLSQFLVLGVTVSCVSTSSKKVTESDVDDIPSSFALVEAAEDECVAIDKLQSSVAFSSDEQVVVRMIGGRCKTVSGRLGFLKSTPWLVMGFPCSKDQAGIEWKGSYYRPEKVQFSINNSCSFAAVGPKQIETYVRTKYGIPKVFPFLAYVPLDTQYWELTNYPDQDLGINVELMTGSSRSEGWTKFRKGSHLDIILYGTENAWMKRKEFYRVEARLLPSADRVKFSIQVNAARRATDSEISALKQNCEKIIPSRPCEKLLVR